MERDKGIREWYSIWLLGVVHGEEGAEP